jgi:acetyltransferase-like isoleucine patch superfamily enzyme
MRRICILSTVKNCLKYKCKIILYSHAKLCTKKNAKISVKETLHIGRKWNACDNQYTSVCIASNGILETEHLSVYDGCKITVKKNAKLVIKTGYLNSNVQINAKQSIQIGESFACANGVVIRDNNAHSINGKKDSNPVIIGNHCWIGTNAVILPGTKLGNNCVVAAGSIVNKEFPDNCLIGGVPAKIIKTDIEWGDAVK